MELLATVLVSTEFIEMCSIALGVGGLWLSTTITQTMNEFLGHIMDSTSKVLIGYVVGGKLLLLVKYITLMFCLL